MQTDTSSSVAGPLRGRVLVVDDDAPVTSYLVEALAAEGFEVQGETSAAAALATLATTEFDLIVSDIEMPEMRGIDLLAAIHARRPEQLVLLMTAFGSIELAVQAVRAGACDFVAKPLKIEVLILAIERALRERQMRREIVRLRTRVGNDDGALIAKSTAMRTVVDLARRSAATDSTVLLTGESGTGKGAVARFIHEQSPRATRPFVAVNCAALPSQLVESELYGVRRGAFTDARNDRQGLFVEATGGTLFLDEIGEMPVESQAKLLQSLESGRIRPLGGGEVAVDVRVIAATNYPLEDALRERRFRPDLYYRLNVIRIELPPLHLRVADIDGLVDLFLERAAHKLNRPLRGISAPALRWLRSHDWPGNVRELANLLERAVALTDHDSILVEDLQSLAQRRSADEFLVESAASGTALAEVERAYIRKVLQSVNGNKARAARLLGIDRRTLYRRMEGD